MQAFGHGDRPNSQTIMEFFSASTASKFWYFTTIHPNLPIYIYLPTYLYISTFICTFISLIIDTDSGAGIVLVTFDNTQTSIDTNRS